MLAPELRDTRPPARTGLTATYRVLIGGFYALDAVEPFHQHFSLQNYTLHYPFAKKERVPVPLLVVIAVLGPAAVIAVYTLVIDGLFSHQAPTASTGRRRKLGGRYRLKDRLWELNCGILGLGLAVAASFVITGRHAERMVYTATMLTLDRCSQECYWKTEARFDCEV